MKFFKSSFFKLFSLIILISLLTACSSKNYHEDMSYSGVEHSEESDTEDMDLSQDNSSKSLIDRFEDKKVIATYYMNLETLDFDNTNEKLNNIIKKHDSFIENSNIRFRGFEYSKNFKYGNFSIRIPKENVEKFIKDLKNIAHVSEESIAKEDVTSSYKDTESRLKLVSSKEKRLLKLLEKAVKIEDIITLESELTETIYEKEALKRNLKSVDDKIEYTTLTLELIEVRSFSNADMTDSSLGTKIKTAFKDSILTFKITIENLIVFFIFILPYFIIIIPLVVLIIKLIKKRKRKS